MLAVKIPVPMLRPPRSLLAALVATTMVVTVALCWFGWRLLVQQRAIDEQRARDQLEVGADAMAAGIRGKLAEAGERLSGWLSNPASSAPAIDGAVVVTVNPDAPEGVMVAPGGGLPFVPVVGPSEVPTDALASGVFASVEEAEFVRNALASASEQYRLLTRHRDRDVRAGAWLRLGRVLRKSGDFAGALEAYQQLAALGTVRAADLPAELAGLEGQRLVSVATGDRKTERRVAAQLLQGLDGGRWLITRGTAEFYRESVSESRRPDSWRLADAVSDVWRESDGRLPARGQRLFSRDGQSVLVLWRSNGSHTALLTAFAESFFAASAPGGMAWRLSDPEGQLLSGDEATLDRSVSRFVGNSEYPWTLQLWAVSPLPGDPRSSGTILLAMMAAMLVFLWGATYLMARAIRREAAVSRLQSDFVAAVSHEFRSPLTTVRQMAEMLEMGRLPTEERRQTYDRVIASEAARLQRLVETLLNFGRMEAGAERYQLVDVDVVALVRQVVREIEPQARDSDTRIEVSGPDAGVRVLADEQALAVALRNLIENAIKYSPARSTVSVGWKVADDRVEISVADRGPGIPRAEQQAIFRKFVRGRSAIDANVKGTGVGLSMARQIVQAHGGAIRLNSEIGRGSTFTIVLPVDEPEGSRRARPEVPSLESETRSPFLKPGA